MFFPYLQFLCPGICLTWERFEESINLLGLSNCILSDARISFTIHYYQAHKTCSFTKNGFFFISGSRSSKWSQLNTELNIKTDSERARAKAVVIYDWGLSLFSESKLIQIGDTPPLHCPWQLKVLYPHRSRSVTMIIISISLHRLRKSCLHHTA